MNGLSLDDEIDTFRHDLWEDSYSASTAASRALNYQPLGLLTDY